MKEIYTKARGRIDPKFCRVCSKCDGKACAGEVPGMGGIGTGASFQNNVAALAARRLSMRVLHGANEPDTALELWGRKLTLPVMAAPIGSVFNNLGSDMGVGRYAEVLIRGCHAAGTLAGIGDTGKAADLEESIANVRDLGKDVMAFIKPWAIDEVKRRFDLAAAVGCEICGMDLDAAGLTLLRRLAAPVGTRTPKELSGIIKAAHERTMRFIAKGIMTADEARLAVEAGADAVLVSNHGGRVLDHTPGTAEVLPGIAEAVGKDAHVFVDGGIRAGADVLKVLAMGAKAALVCRPLAIVAHGDEEQGIPRYFAAMREDLAQSMRLTGCANLAAVGRHVVC